MSEWKTRTAAHLRAAQGWLSKAERSFDEKKEIRGELNLMLAQAELKRAQEEKRTSKTRFRYACYRHGGALICAMLLFGIGSLIWMGRGADEVKATAPSSVQMTAAQQAEPIALQPVVSHSSIAAGGEAQVPRASTTRYEAHNEARQASSAVSLSQEEMRDLMQAAGRSLRGQ